MMPIEPDLVRSYDPAPRKVRGLLQGVILGAGLTIVATASPPEENPLPRRIPSGGALVICGGGELPEPIRNRFLELAGGPRARIVVIPTADMMADGPAA